MPRSPALARAPAPAPAISIRIPLRLIGAGAFLALFLLLLALGSWSAGDPSLSNAVDGAPNNWLGMPGAITADILFQFLGLAALVGLLPPLLWSWALIKNRALGNLLARALFWLGAILASAATFSLLPIPATWPLPTGLGGLAGYGFSASAAFVSGAVPQGAAAIVYGLILVPVSVGFLWLSVRASHVDTNGTVRTSRRSGNAASDGRELDNSNLLAAFATSTGAMALVVLGAVTHAYFKARIALAARWHNRNGEPAVQDAALTHSAAEYQDGAPFEGPETHRIEPHFAGQNCAGRDDAEVDADAMPLETPAPAETTARVVTPRTTRVRQSRRAAAEAQASLLERNSFELPPLDLLAEPAPPGAIPEQSPAALEQNARLLEGVLDDFGIRGDIINVRPGPVVTLYELEPAPGIKSSRVIGLADDIARSMSAISARVAVIPGRNAIGIELPNLTRETVFLRELLGSTDFEKVKSKLPLCMGKTIGGDPVITDLARMPHLLIAGTTGSGKSVAINTFILSLLYRFTPNDCRLIMIDPKMLELSVYDGIPHLLTPVVTDPAKAVTALKWAVREMEDRYRKMSKIGVRNIDGFNARVAEAAKKGETITRTVQTGFDKQTGEPMYESESFDLEPLPFIVVIVDEMADLMMVAGKDIEGAIQRLAQMARAAGIHLIMATQRPSVDVITGTIKANFPTRISFQVTSKIDSRTILGEQGAEQLLGMGDMLYMAGGGRIRRLHGPFVADGEVEEVVAHLKSQGSPEYLESVTFEEEDDQAGFGMDVGSSGNELYDKAVAIVLADRKASTSYIQRRLSIGYNRAASLIEKMETEGVISKANHAGKREVLVGDNADGY
jgi:DNA segregation ATPase FtsK/SpoIIIE, S-DNA-T family